MYVCVCGGGVMMDYIGVNTAADAGLDQTIDLREDVGELYQWFLVFCRRIVGVTRHSIRFLTFTGLC
jgi:hypothetical protein